MPIIMLFAYSTLLIINHTNNVVNNIKNIVNNL